MNVLRGRAGGGQGGGDLARDMAALAHTGHHDPPGCLNVAEAIERADEILIQNFGKRFETGGLRRQHAAGDGNIIRLAVNLVVRTFHGCRGHIRNFPCAHFAPILQLPHGGF